VRSGFHFDEKRDITSPNGREDFFADLDRSFCPAMLLAFEAVHIDREFGGCFNVIEKNKAPSLELGSIAEVHVLGECVVFPSTSVGDAGFPPNAAGSIEREKAP
jgi:hypothetical protein